MSGDRRPRRSPSIAWQTIDGETVLLRLKEKELLGLNRVAGRIWELADGTRSIDQIVGSMVSDFRIPAEVARADALRFLQELTTLSALDWPPE